MRKRSRFKRELCVNLVVIGQLLDLCTTAYGLHRLGWREANPFAAYVIRKYGFHQAAMIKMAIALYLGKRASPLVAGITWAPVINNLLL